MWAGATVFDAIFRLLFNYRPVVFQTGEFRFVPSTGSYVAAVIVAVAAAITIMTYRRARTQSDAWHRLVLSGIRLAIFAVVLFCLFRPVLVVKAAVPQQNFLGVLLDDSRSMQIADVNGQPRSAFVKQNFAGTDAALMKTLSSRFVLRSFRFSSNAQRLASPSDLTFGGAQTKISAALDGARQELAGLPLAGLVVVSDGADTTDAELSEALLAMKAANVPVFTVGLGRETLTKDVQIDRVSTPTSALKGTSLMVDALITQTGYAGETVKLDVEDEGRIVGSQEVKLPIDGEPAAVRVRFTASDPGPRVFRFRISPQVGELVTQNNQREALIDVYDRTEKILYFEGEPRPELKFIHRAVDDDKNLQVVTLLRTADNKYLPPRPRHAGSTGRWIPENTRRAVRLSRVDPGQHRSRCVHRRSAAHDLGVRRAPRRRLADARRLAILLGGWVRGHAGRGRTTGRRRSRRQGGRQLGRAAPEDQANTRGRRARARADCRHGSGLTESMERPADVD